MKTLYFRAATLDQLLAALTFIGRDEDGRLFTHDHRAGWDLALVEPGSIITEMRDPEAGDDLAGADVLRVPNPDYDPDGSDKTSRYAIKVVTARSDMWHANLLLHPGSAIEDQIDPALVLDPPATPQHRFASPL